ncbi:MAG: hypothetical protein LBT83_10745, partial [Tannerella sp.]|nr:hypothetical protein [Tannerella sp.]
MQPRHCTRRQAIARTANRTGCPAIASRFALTVKIDVMPPKPIKTTDDALLTRLKQGEEAAFEAVYWKYSAWIYNFVHSLLQDKTLTEDVTQSVFLKIWEKHAEIDAAANFESWLFTIARNLVYKETER